MTNVEDRLMESLDREAEAATVTFTATDVMSSTPGSNPAPIKAHRRWFVVTAAVLVGLVASWALLGYGDRSVTVSTAEPSTGTHSEETSATEQVDDPTPDVTIDDSAAPSGEETADACTLADFSEPSLCESTIEEAERLVSSFLAAIRSGDDTAARAMWTGYPYDVNSGSANAGAGYDQFLDEYQWIRTSRNLDILVVPSFAFADASPVVSIASRDDSDHSASFVLSMPVADTPLVIERLASGRFPVTPTPGEGVDPGQVVTFGSMPVEGSARVFLNETELEANIDHEQFNVTAVLPDELPETFVLTIALATPEFPAAHSVAFRRNNPSLHGRPFVVGSIEIDAINLSSDILNSVEAPTLSLGPGRYPAAANAGEEGNFAIAGNRTIFGAEFDRLDELLVGDEIRVSTSDRTFVYVVMAQPDGEAFVIVSPSDTSVLDDTGSALLTLTTHHPKFSARQRLIVQAALVGDPIGPSSADPATQLTRLP